MSSKKSRDEPKLGQEQAADSKDEQVQAGQVRDAKGRFVKQEKGKSKLPGRPYTARDVRAVEAAKASAAKRREKGDLRRLCQIWMEEEVGTGKDGERITGGQMMVRVAVKEVSKGNPKFWELLRDTAGFKPVDKVMVAEVDPAVIDEVEQMVKEVGNG